MKDRAGSPDSRRILGLIVTYNPDNDLLLRVLQRLLPQVDTVVVVDNGSASSPGSVLSLVEDDKVRLILLASNLGLATAQNRGIQWARDTGFSHIVFFDQDSLAEPGLVDALMQGLQELEESGVPVAAVGPVHIDPRSGTPSSFVLFPGLRPIRESCRSEKGAIETDFLLSSGTLIPVTSFSRIGLFEDDLFIDLVDTEWCFRARSRGYRLYGVCRARLHHLLGDDVTRIWFGRWRNVYHHKNPLRHYYTVRNHIVLYRRSYAPTNWVLMDITQMAARILLFGFVLKPRFRYLGFILQGFRDGLRKRLGPYPGSGV